MQKLTYDGDGDKDQKEVKVEIPGIV